VIAVALTVAVAVAAGIGAERRWEERARSAARWLLGAMLYTLVPFVVFFNIARLHVSVDVGAGLGLAYVMLGAVGLAAWLVGRRVLALERPATGSLVASVVQVNTGYLGLPLIAALLGPHALGQAAAYDTLVSAPVLFGPVFAIGAAFGRDAGEGRRERLRAFFIRNPPLLAVVAALLAPDSLAPDALVDASRVVVFLLAPAGFFAVGVTLAAEAETGSLPVPPPLTPAIGCALALRLLVAPAVLYLLALPLIDLPDAYLVQAAMPTGINALVVAHAYGLDLRPLAGTIAWSTGIVLVAALVGAAVT
jgi:malate permease and related proteins